MFGWNKDKSKTSSKKKSNDIPPNNKKQSSEDIRAQALANARQARESIGEENLKKLTTMLEAMHDQLPPPDHRSPAKQEPIHISGEYRLPKGSPAQQARDILQEMDKGDLADALRDMIEKDRN